MDYLGAVLAMLGEPQDRYADPAAWVRLEGGLGLALPADFKRLVDAYAPVVLNGHLYLLHPATERWNLGEEIREDVRALSDVDWQEYELDPDPRLVLGVPEMCFGSADGLLPIASTDRSEKLFYGPGEDGTPCGRIFVEIGDDGFYPYDVTFSEWLYRWLTGDDLPGPDVRAFYPGPVAMQWLPMAAGERPRVFYVPPRGM
jgi:hypothetical protein